MTLPIRIQRKRTKGYDMQAESRAINGLECVYVGRPSVFGNLSACVYPNCKLDPDNCNGWCCVKGYREYVLSGLEDRPSRGGTFNVVCDASEGYPYRTRLIKNLPRLRGKNLACFCRLDQPCHADVLLELANKQDKE